MVSRPSQLDITTRYITRTHNSNYNSNKQQQLMTRIYKNITFPSFFFKETWAESAAAEEEEDVTPPPPPPGGSQKTWDSSSSRRRRRRRNPPVGAHYNSSSSSSVNISTDGWRALMSAHVCASLTLAQHSTTLVQVSSAAVSRHLHWFRLLLFRLDDPEAAAGTAAAPAPAPHCTPLHVIFDN